MGDGQERTRPEVTEVMAAEFNLTPEERELLLPSGKALVVRSRTGWAMTYLGQAALLERVKRGLWRISRRGREALAGNPSRIDVPFLMQYPEFVAFRSLRHSEGPAFAELAEPRQTPDEALELAYQRLRGELEAQLLAQVKLMRPSSFERLVVELLVAMGYGGTLQDAGRAVGQSGDGGIDGIIKEDKLGLDQIYIQAKRWENSVGRPEVQKFAGALQGHRATKGVFITTAQFTKEAIDYVDRIDSKIILVDGSMLSRLMVDHGVGVSTVSTYEVKRLEAEYFADE
jgi:restriction system protein